MIPVLAHGGTGGLVVELSLLSLPLIGFALLWWWNRRLTREQAAESTSVGARTRTSPTNTSRPVSPLHRAPPPIVPLGYPDARADTSASEQAPQRPLRLPWAFRAAATSSARWATLGGMESGAAKPSRAMASFTKRPSGSR